MTFNINIQNFEGPLDLLLFFVQRDKMDIYDISQKYKKVPMMIKISNQLPYSPCERPHPGYLNNEKLSDEKLSDEKLYKNITCKKITKKVLEDNKNIILKPQNSKKCPKNHY